MTSSLVGSEMCIRDRSLPDTAVYCICAVEATHDYSGETVQSGTWSVTVSYTHLTLPTICSV
eukprot:9896646-Prorocentrum_lima.AAC.1